MNITLTINDTTHETNVSPNETLLTTLRGLGFHGVKFGDEHGLSGADTVLLDGKPVNAGSMLAAQAEGHKIVTIEGLGEHPEQGWKKTDGLASAATGLHRDRRDPVRILHARADSGGQGAAGRKSKSQRSGSPRGDCGRAVSLHGLCQTCPGSVARGGGNAWRSR